MLIEACSVLSTDEVPRDDLHRDENPTICQQLLASARSVQILYNLRACCF